MLINLLFNNVLMKTETSEKRSSRRVEKIRDYVTRLSIFGDPEVYAQIERVYGNLPRGRKADALKLVLGRLESIPERCLYTGHFNNMKGPLLTAHIELVRPGRYEGHYQAARNLLKRYHNDFLLLRGDSIDADGSIDPKVGNRFAFARALLASGMGARYAEVAEKRFLAQVVRGIRAIVVRASRDPAEAAKNLELSFPKYAFTWLDQETFTSEDGVWNDRDIAIDFKEFAKQKAEPELKT